MTKLERAAMQQALEYCEDNMSCEAANVLKLALAEQAEPMTDTELINTNCRYTTPLMAEQAEQEPVHWTQREIHPNERRAMEAQDYPFSFPPLSKAAMREVLAEPTAKEKAESYREGYMDGRRDSKLAEQAEQEPVIRATLAPPAPPEVYQMRSRDAYEAGWWEAQRQKAVSPIAPAQQAEQDPVAEAIEAIAAETRLQRAVRAVASQAGESAEDTIEWLCNGGMAQLFECHFSGKNRESLCEDEGCPHRGVPHICIEKQAEQEPVAWYAEDNLEERDEIEVIWTRSKPQYAEVWKPLYAAPVQQVDLTDDEICEAVESVNEAMVGWITYRAVIAADREKNRG